MAATKRPLWFGVVITPLVTPLVFIVGAIALYAIMGFRSQGLSSWMGSLAFRYLLEVALGYLSICLLGWPWLIILQRRDKLTVGYLCFGASLIGMFSFIMLCVLIGNYHYRVAQNLIEQIVEQSVIGLILGLVSGLIFSLVSGVPLKAQD